MPALQKWEWFISGDRSSRLTCVLKKSDRLPASANETFPLDLFAENSLRSQIHQNSETKTFAKNHKSPYFYLVSANVTFQKNNKKNCALKIERKKQWKGVSPSLRAPFIQDQRFHEKWIWANVSAVTRMFLVFWFLHFSPIESWKLQLNPLRIGSKRFQILLMLVIFISNWTRSTVCGFCNTLSKKEQQHFFFVCKELEQRNAKCKEDRHYYEIEMLLIHKRAVSLLKGERGEENPSDLFSSATLRLDIHGSP